MHPLKCHQFSFARSLIKLALARNGYLAHPSRPFSSLPELAFVVKREPQDERPEMFGVEVLWAADKADISEARLKDCEAYAREKGFPFFQAVVLGEGREVIASTELKNRMRYAEEDLTVITFREFFGKPEID